MSCAHFRYVIGYSKDIPDSLKVINDTTIVYLVGNFIALQNVETHTQFLIPVFSKAAAKNGTVQENHVYNFEYTAVATTANAKIYAIGITRLSKDGLSNKHMIKLFNLDKKEHMGSYNFPSKVDIFV